MRELTVDCQVGEQVFWKTLVGNRYEGILKEWDSNVAIVKCNDSLTRATEC